jgi:thioredoxin reductase (NADPH)
VRSAELAPEAKRAVLLGPGELNATREDLLRSAALGDIETYLSKPTRQPDEPFYRAVGRFIEDWDRLNRPQFELIRLIGDPWDPGVLRIRDAMYRSGLPTGFYAADSDAGRALLEQAGTAGPLPVVVTFDGRVLTEPTGAQIAALLGVNVDPSGHNFDVIVVGAGPAGLAAAVYAASEGLHVLIVETEALGGQASTSSLIRNYLGFPRGLSGVDLTTRAYWQAWFFGARFILGRNAAGLRADGDLRVLLLDDGTQARARAIVLASGVSYRRVGIESIERFVGRGVFYGAPVTQAPGIADQPVLVVGGGNSSAQAALFLARYASRVTLVVRNPGLEDMSQYLIDDITADSSIEVRPNTALVGAEGDTRLRRVTLHDRVRDVRDTVQASAVFVLIGGEPRTEWLPPEIVRDERGYVLTGADVNAVMYEVADRPALHYETSMPGVFAAGDVRQGGLKRVAAAVGDGSSTIRHVHEYLALHAHAHREVAPTKS